jgi:hypothetical protein
MSRDSRPGTCGGSIPERRGRARGRLAAGPGAGGVETGGRWPNHLDHQRTHHGRRGGAGVVVEPQELDQFRPTQDKALLLEHFLPAHQVEPTYFAGRSLYLLADGLAAHHPYAVVAQAMRQAGTWALGRVGLSGRRSLVLVRPAGRLLVLDVLHYPVQLRAAPAMPAEWRGGQATAEEQRLARAAPIIWRRSRPGTPTPPTSAPTFTAWGAFSTTP